ncbi:MAG TPA: 6,7-dimethyl-8-ribityllumazine synthase [Solirubrobacterales bacterium]|nr:6,7-dimethyl-8-ribityllumazine synthase [Solirubrobacterales bacterium]
MAADRYAICVGDFYEDLAERLVDGSREEFARHGKHAEAIDVHEVPGAFELPLAAQYCARSRLYRGVVCLGAVIRGETDHYDFVCGEAARGIQEVQLETGVPCGFGVLTVDSMEQALSRTGGGKRDQGADATRAVLRMAELRSELAGRSHDHLPSSD